VKKKGLRRQRIFATRKEAVLWEAEQKKAEWWKTDTPFWTLMKWSNEYLDYAERRFTGKTYQEKMSAFRRFLRFMQPDTPLTAIEPGDFLRHLEKEEAERSGYAANKDRKNLGAAWNWGRKYLRGFPQDPNPFLAVDKRPEVRSPRYVPPEADFWRVYEFAQGQDRVMLLTFLHLAARRSEVFRLTCSDLDFANKRIRLWTRKRKSGNFEHDWLPMTKELKQALLWWWEHRPVKDREHVFLCLDDTPFCHDYYGKPFKYRLQFMRRLCDRAGVKRFGFHAIRHLSATVLYNLGYEASLIQLILRHKNPSTTDRYLRSLGLGRAREALEELTQERGKVLPFRPKKVATQ